MKVMAIGTLKPLSPEQRQRYLPKEVPATLQLYLDRKMEQFWMRDQQEGVIFLMSVDSMRRTGCSRRSRWFRMGASRQTCTDFHGGKRLLCLTVRGDQNIVGQNGAGAARAGSDCTSARVCL